MAQGGDLFVQLAVDFLLLLAQLVDQFLQPGRLLPAGRRSPPPGACRPLPAPGWLPSAPLPPGPGGPARWRSLFFQRPSPPGSRPCSAVGISPWRSPPAGTARAAILSGRPAGRFSCRLSWLSSCRFLSSISFCAASRRSFSCFFFASFSCFCFCSISVLGPQVVQGFLRVAERRLQVGVGGQIDPGLPGLLPEGGQLGGMDLFLVPEFVVHLAQRSFPLSFLHAFPKYLFQSHGSPPGERVMARIVWEIGAKFKSIPAGRRKIVNPDRGMSVAAPA